MANLTKSAVIELLASNDKAIGRALLVLFANQTPDERFTESTKHHNGKGFRPCHARIGTSMAKQFERTGKLSTLQANYWRVRGKEGMRIGIYAGQLLVAAEEKAARKQIAVNFG